MKHEAQKRDEISSGFGIRTSFVIRHSSFVISLLAFFVLDSFAGFGTPSDEGLLRRPWFLARTVHFNIYSCGNTQEVARVAARLEQFRNAYSSLAGSQAVASPPIVVIAFPDHATMQPFLTAAATKI